MPARLIESLVEFRMKAALVAGIHSDSTKTNFQFNLQTGIETWPKLPQHSV